MLGIGYERFSKPLLVGKNNVNTKTKQSENMNLHQQQTHDEVWALLPWYVNGTLSDGEREMTDAHINVCLVCRRELLALSELAVAVLQRNEDVGCENALARLHTRIDKQPSPREMPWAAAASLILVIGLAFMTSHKVTGGLLDFGSGYQTLGAPRVTDGNLVSRSARIVFRQNVDATKLVSLLDGVDATIADGPSRRGTYTIEFSNAISSEEQQHAISLLRESGDVLLVEPVARTLNGRFYR